MRERGERERRKGTGGTDSPFANSSIRPCHFHYKWEPNYLPFSEFYIFPDLKIFFNTPGL